VGGQRHPRPLYLRERRGTHCKGGWVDPRVGLDGCGKSGPPPLVSSYNDCAMILRLFLQNYPSCIYQPKLFPVSCSNLAQFHPSAKYWVAERVEGETKLFSAFFSSCSYETSSFVLQGISRAWTLNLWFYCCMKFNEHNSAVKHSGFSAVKECLLRLYVGRRNLHGDM